MLDYTNLTANPIPIAINELQIANEVLEVKNKKIKHLLIGVLIVVGVVGIIYYRKRNKKNELREQYRIK
jgi:hypothetical protein